MSVARLPGAGRALSRREFLRIGAGTALALPVLAACRGAVTPSAPAGPLVSPDAPVTWPIEPGELIRSDLPIERGATLRVYEWREYLSRRVLDDFVRRYRHYDVRYEVKSFDNRDESLATIRRPDADFDVFFPTVDAVGDLVGAGLLRPLNHDYLPNIGNLWPQFRGDGPFYDRGARYTVPYTVFSTGIGWRSDLVRGSDAPDVADDPFGVFWNPRYRGRVGLYDAYREGLAMALIHDGGPDVNTGSETALAAAADSLIGMIPAVGVQVTTEGAYEGLPDGSFAVHQAWSGDVISGPRFGDAPPARSAPLLRYWWPTDGTGVVGSDLLAILSRGRNPVLAHAFLDHLLDVETATRNFTWNGYQPPLTGATADALSSLRAAWGPVVPENMRSAILTPEQFDRSAKLLPLSPTVDTAWTAQWTRFTSRL